MSVNNTININNTSESSISNIVDITTEAVFVGYNKFKNNSTDFTPSRIPDTTIGTGSSDYSSDQNNTWGFETWTFAVIAIVAVVFVIIFVVIMARLCHSTKPAVKAMKQTRSINRHFERY